MTDPENTTPEMLVRAAGIAQQNGIRYVYAGNLPGRVGSLENTYCHRAARCSSNATGITCSATA